MDKERIFRFKQFEVSHGHSALPVGMDGVLIGAWADVSYARNILDVGTGCGVIALMCAQRNAGAVVTGIDIHKPSVLEALGNFKASPWSERLNAFCTDFNAFADASAKINADVSANYIADASDNSSFAGLNFGNGYILPRKFDLIVSNPPFFNSGVELGDHATARLVARHAGSFGPAQLISSGTRILTGTGSIATIFPAGQKNLILRKCHEAGLQVKRLCYVVSRPGTPPKRVMLQASICKPDKSLQQGTYMETTLCIYDGNAEYSEAYKTLTHDFYLKF